MGTASKTSKAIKESFNPRHKKLATTDMMCISSPDEVPFQSGKFVQSLTE